MTGPIPGFVGFFNIDGPIGYVEAEQEEAVKILIDSITHKYPKAKAGRIWYSLRYKVYWASIWTRA